MGRVPTQWWDLELLGEEIFPCNDWQRSAWQAPHLVTRGWWSRLEGPLFYTGGSQSPEVIHPLPKAPERGACLHVTGLLVSNSSDCPENISFTIKGFLAWGQPVFREEGGALG